MSSYFPPPPKKIKEYLMLIYIWINCCIKCDAKSLKKMKLIRSNLRLNKEFHLSNYSLKAVTHQAIVFEYY